MAARKKKTTSRRRAKPRRRNAAPRAGIMQRLLVGLAGVVLVLCAASITQGFFFRTGPGDADFRIEVLNGTGVNGLAHAAKRALHRRGIDVIEVGNADRFDYPESILIRCKRDADVEALGRILRCPNIVEQIREDGLADATLILGADYLDLDLDWKLETDLAE